MKSFENGKLLDDTTPQYRKQSAWQHLELSKGDVKRGEALNESSLVFLMSGRLSVSVGNLKNLIISEKEMLLIPNGSVYCVETLEDSRAIVCLFRIEVLLHAQYHVADLLPLCRESASSVSILTIHKTLFCYLLLISEYVVCEIDNSDFFSLKKRELFFLLTFCYSKQELADFLYPIICEDLLFKEFVINNYLAVKDIGELASLANYSTSGFIKKFRRCFNESPYKWILEQKAKKILIDMTSGTIRLKEIAFKYNFSSYQHFSDFCKTHYGASPSTITGKKNGLKMSNNINFGDII